MAWSNLLSGLIGALIGGLFSIAASVMTMRQERSQARQRASHTAASAIVDNILTIKKAMEDIQAAADVGSDSSFEAIHAASERILFVYNVLIANKELRSRISELIKRVNAWYENARKSSKTANQERIDSIISYMGYVRQSIEAHLEDPRLPKRISSSDVQATESPEATSVNAGLSKRST
jgi:hypothetical protein